MIVVGIVLVDVTVAEIVPVEVTSVGTIAVCKLVMILFNVEMTV